MPLLFVILFFSISVQGAEILPYEKFRGGLACDLALKKFVAGSKTDELPMARASLQKLVGQIEPGRFPVLDEYSDGRYFAPVLVFRGREARENLGRLAESAEAEYRDLEKNFAKAKLSVFQKVKNVSLGIYGLGIAAMIGSVLTYAQVPSRWFIAAFVASAMTTTMSAVFKIAMDSDIFNFNRRLEIPDFDPPRPTPLRELFSHSLGGHSRKILVKEFLPDELAPKNSVYLGDDDHIDRQIANSTSRWVGILSWDGSEPVVHLLLRAGLDD